MGKRELENRSIPLDVLRIFACAWVWVYHWTGNAATWKEFQYAPTMNFEIIPKSLANIFDLGYLGVDLFFVLSGFVVAKSALKNSPVSFAHNRIVRIFPTYFICSIVTLIVYSLAQGKRSISEGIIWITAIPLISSSRPYMGTAWTLHHEIIFYFIVFLCILFFKNKKFGLLILSNLICFFMFYNFLLIEHKRYDPIFINSFISFLPYFLLGVLVQVIDTKKLFIYNCVVLFLCEFLVFRQLNMRILDHSIKLTIIIFVFLNLILCLNGIQKYLRHHSVDSVQNLIKVPSLMTYPIYLLHLTFGAAIISIGGSIGLTLTSCILISSALLLLVSYWCVMIFEPKFKSVYFNLLSRT
jgi:peptidoglycan/LPS O-acetylase OafA/YrhL